MSNDESKVDSLPVVKGEKVREWLVYPDREQEETMLDVFSRREHERFDSWGDQAPMGVWSA